MKPITELFYKRIKNIISEWNDDDIYAVSFFVYSNEDFSYNGFENVSSFAVSYNTEEFCEGAGKYNEERWNYAFWSQDETMIIDPNEPDELIKALYEWYKENGIDNIGFEDDENDYDEDDNYIGKGPVGHFELITIASEAAEELQKEGFLKKKFGKPVPIIIHGLEYAPCEIEATKKANPHNEAKDFFKAVKKGNI